jgi:orotidine-5'-phosphate decarboxylase
MRDVIIACDFSSNEELHSFLEKLGDERPFLKIGMELFYASGPAIVKELKDRGHKIFLDLKLHDIPNTVMKAMNVLSKLDVDICDLHIAGGSEMMKYAIKGLTREDGTRPLLIGITQLTSISDDMLHNELLIEEDKIVEQVVMHYAKNAQNSGLDGIVCSPLEAGDVKKVCGKSFITVTPGIRFADNEKGDQVRVATPEFAKLNSDYIVVGRPITKAENPLQAYLRCVKEFI